MSVAHSMNLSCSNAAVSLACSFFYTDDTQQTSLVVWNIIACVLNGVSLRPPARPSVCRLTAIIIIIIKWLAPPEVQLFPQHDVSGNVYVHYARLGRGRCSGSWGFPRLSAARTDEHGRSDVAHSLVDGWWRLVVSGSDREMRRLGRCSQTVWGVGLGWCEARWMRLRAVSDTRKKTIL